MNFEDQTRLFLSVTAGRLLIFVLLVATAALFPGSFSASVHTNYLSFLLGCAFLLTLIWIYWFQKKGLSDSLKSCQTVSDVILASLAVYLTGGIDSRFTFLYSIAIITACLLGPGRMGALSALLSTLFYALVCILTSNHVTGVEEAAFTFFLNMGAFNTVALLALYLSKKLKTAEDRLQATAKDVHLLEEIQKHLANSLRSGLITVDVNGFVLYYNISAQQILGNLVLNSYGKPLEEVLPGTERLLATCYEEFGADKRKEIEIKTENGKTILGISCFQIRDHQGGMLGHGIIFQDITEIKAQEERLKLIDRLAALGEMAAGLAHEIRNPLASISGAAEFLNQNGLVMPEGQRLLSIIEKEVERLSELTNSFLLYGRPERKLPQRIRLKAEISTALILLRQRKKLKQADVQIDIPEKLEIQADGDMLRQVIINILLNAFQALPQKGGKITIKARKEKKNVNLEIKDNGTGITKESLKKIFNPFFTTKPKGTGLGLSIVHRIVTELGGKINVDSAPEKGSRFLITLPVDELDNDLTDEQAFKDYEAASRFSIRNLSMS